MADWRCLTAAEQSMVQALGYDPAPMVVNRLGEGHWMFLDMKSRAELLVSRQENGKLRATLEEAVITPPRRAMGI